MFVCRYVIFEVQAVHLVKTGIVSCQIINEYFVSFEVHFYTYMFFSLCSQCFIKLPKNINFPKCFIRIVQICFFLVFSIFHANSFLTNDTVNQIRCLFSEIHEFYVFIF